MVDSIGVSEFRADGDMRLRSGGADQRSEVHNALGGGRAAPTAAMGYTSGMSTTRWRYKRSRSAVSFAAVPHTQHSSDLAVEFETHPVVADS